MPEIMPVAVLAPAPLLSAYHDALTACRACRVLFSAASPNEFWAFWANQTPNAPKPLVVADLTQGGVWDGVPGAVKAAGLPLIAVVSSVRDGFTAIERGASEMIVRRGGDHENLAFFYACLLQLVEKIAGETRRVRPAGDGFRGRIIAIGSSTGGTETLLEILRQLPADAPPVLAVQHMPPVFTKLYADRADELCAIRVAEARDGDRLANGLCLIAPGDYHMTLAKRGAEYCVECQKGPRVHNQCPSVDVLFNSVAALTREAVGVILTGMGADGAKGLLAMRRRGSYTIGQDEATSVVYGMPRAAFEMGAVAAQLPVQRIPKDILDHIYA